MVVFLLNLCSWYLKIKKCKTTEKIFENNFMQAFLFIFFLQPDNSSLYTDKISEDTIKTNRYYF